MATSTSKATTKAPAKTTKATAATKAKAPAKTGAVAAKTVAAKSTATKAAAKPAAAAKPKAAKPAAAVAAKRAAVTPDQRRFYVEVAAYYIAERRGFHGGSELADWAQAEKEIDQLLADGRINA